MSRLHDIAIDPVECSRGLLGYFYSVQMDDIESLFATIGVPDPWEMVINPLWASLLYQVGGGTWSSKKTVPFLPPLSPLNKRGGTSLLVHSFASDAVVPRHASRKLRSGPISGVSLSETTPNVSCQEDTQIMLAEEVDDDWDSDSDVSADDAHASSWSARIC